MNLSKATPTMRSVGTAWASGTSLDGGGKSHGVFSGMYSAQITRCRAPLTSRSSVCSKSVLIDSRFGPAWLAFAHSYAFEGEHDQAITAYSTALRHSQGSHQPLLFIGMQQLGLMNLTLAEEYLNTAKSICNEDPLATNELGVVAVHAGRYVAFLFPVPRRSLSRRSPDTTRQSCCSRRRYAWQKMYREPQQRGQRRISTLAMHTASSSESHSDDHSNLPRSSFHSSQATA